MKKTKLFNRIAFISLSLLFWNCQHESLEENIELSEASKVLSGIKQENTTLAEIKNDPGLNFIIQKATKKMKKNESSSKNEYAGSFNLNLSNQVKKYVLNDYTSYTIPIVNDLENSYIFQNLVIEKDILRDAAYLVTYYPDENYKESIRKRLVNINDNIDYTGSKKIEYLYYKRKVNIEEKTKTSKTGKSTIEIAPDGDIDEPLTICIETYTPRNCTAGGNHSPGQSCSGTGGQRAGWIVSESCTTISNTPVPGPGSGPGCTGCAEPGGSSSGGGNYFPADSQNPNWIPQYICVAMESGKCTKVIPYTPILTMAIVNPYNYYIDVFDRQKVELLTRFGNADIKTAIDEYLENNKNERGIYDAYTRDLVNNVFDAAIANPAPGIAEGSLTDVWASLRSPVNIDRSNISNETIEGKKFNSTYNALTQSLSFQKLFVDLFGNDTRFNVKFEVDDHVYENNNPSKKEVNAITIHTPGTNNIIIKFNKQILIPDTSKSQTNIENAKTILHECIHAYLFVKANYPAVGEDFVKILNSMYPTVNEQHDFMYNRMIPTMQTVLSEIRDLVTTTPKRANLEQYTMHPTQNPLTSTEFNWNDYYRCVILNGLQETNCFIQDFPFPSDMYDLYKQYINAGNNELDR
jgi:hypothetical protein